MGVKLASVSLREWAMGRDVEFPPSKEIVERATVLLGRVNRLLERLQWPSPVYVSSGYRPGHFNRSPQGKEWSQLHPNGWALDLADPRGDLKMAILASGGERLLAEVDLHMESPSFTPTWCHLDVWPRRNRIFLP